MPREMLTYRVFISSPADLGQQRQVAKEAVETLSRQYERRNIKIVPWLWEQEATSDFGRDAQTLITAQLGQYDIYIGLMGARFGSATARYGSGTEEEFYEAFKANRSTGWPGIGFFFKEVTLSTTTLDEDSIQQLARVQKFRQEIGRVGLYREFLEDHTLSNHVSSTVASIIDTGNAHLGVTPVQYGLSFETTKAGVTISRSFLSEVLAVVDENLTAGGSRLTLNELWIEPELRDLSKVDSEKLIKFDIGVEELTLEFEELGSAILLSGGETSGKSSICRQLYQSLFSAGRLPVLFEGERVNNPDVDRFRRRVRVQMNEQYDGLEELSDEALRDKCVIIIDDYDAAKLSRVHAGELLTALKKAFCGVALTVTTGYEFQFLENVENASALSSFRRLEIGDLGQKKRYGLIERWCDALRTSQGSEVYRHTVEDRRKIVNRVLGSNLVPRTPFMVLILLQAIDVGKDSDLAKTGYVRYYKFLIDSAILKNISPKDAEGTYALLPELAWEAYTSVGKTLSAQAAESVIEKFAAKKALPKTALYSVLGSLRAIGIFDSLGDGHRFRHPYVYYFFVAEYISLRLAETDRNVLITRLCREVYIKESATLLVFLAYFADNQVIVKTLVEGLASAYVSHVPFEFTADRTASINRLVLELPKIVVDASKTKEQRHARLDAEDKDDQDGQNPSADQPESIYTIRSAFTAVEILGHILRNHYAKLDAEPKRVIVNTTSQAVLRCIGSIFDTISESSETLMSAINIVSDKVEQADSVESKTRAAADVFFFIAYAFTYYSCRQLARAIGDENLEVTYRQIIKENPNSTIRKFLDALIKLESFREFPLDEVREISTMLKSNKVAMATLRLAVAERLDMKPPASNDLQRICDMVQLKLKSRIIAKGRR